MKFILMPKLRLTRDPLRDAAHTQALHCLLHSPLFTLPSSLSPLHSGQVDEALTLIAELTLFRQKSTILFAIFQHYRTPSTPDQKDSIHIKDNEDKSHKRINAIKLRGTRADTPTGLLQRKKS